MYYFKSDPRRLSLKPHMSGLVFSKKTEISAKNLKPCFSNIKLKLNIKNKQTAPLMLFVNLLMKHGKKTHALRVLDKTLYLFKAKISKIKTRVEKRKPFLYYQKFNYLKQCLNNTFSRNFISDYNIKLFHFTFISLKKGIPFSISADFSKYIFSVKNYRKAFPFFYNFCFFTDFYISKRFFRGKFLYLNQWKIELLSKESNSCKNLFFTAKKIYPCRFKLENYKMVSRKTRKLKNTLFCQNSENNTTFPQKYLWYKNPVKNSSWDRLTVTQKNTFLYCLYKAISNVKPPLECRTKRIGGSNKQIPSQISEHRQWGIAIRWIIEAAKSHFLKKRSDTIGKGMSKGLVKLKPVALLYQSNKSEGVQDQSKSPRRAYNDNKSTALTPFSKSFLKEHSSKTKFYRFCFSLAESLENAYYKKGPAMHKRNVWIDVALSNRAFLRYRWW